MRRLLLCPQCKSDYVLSGKELDEAKSKSPMKTTCVECSCPLTITHRGGGFIDIKRGTK